MCVCISVCVQCKSFSALRCLEQGPLGCHINFLLAAGLLVRCVLCFSVCVCVYLCVYLCVYVCVPTRENILWEAFVWMERTLRIFLMCWSETCQISDGFVGVRTEGSAEEIGEPWQRVTAENKAFLLYRRYERSQRPTTRSGDV